METVTEAREKIFSEVISDDNSVRAEYLKHFQQDIQQFSTAMAEAVMRWQAFYRAVEDSERGRRIAALVMTAITLHVVSMKLMISGCTVAAGNLMRQVLEAIAVAFLCSNHELGILDQFIDGRYSTKKAVRHVIQQARKLGLVKEGVIQLDRAQNFYHQYSHVSILTIAAGLRLDDQQPVVGAFFDDAKLDSYKKEIGGRVSLAEVFPNFVDAVAANVAKWPPTTAPG
jgi:hypothetical protein